jgi:mannose-6-phosphate isomerase-like protein (cupin superfamily)
MGNNKQIKQDNSTKDIIVLEKGEGREYDCGGMAAIFKADENETDNKYGIAEWWLKPNSEGKLEKTLYPGAHSHTNKVEVFYVLEGTISFLVDDKWIEAKQGTFIRIPVGTTHTFANRTDKKTGFLNFYTPGGFESGMPAKMV